MPVYTASALATYMRDGVLRATGTVLGLTAEAAYAEAVTDVAHAAGVADVALASDVGLLRLLAQREAWKLAMGVAAGDYGYSENGASFNRQQIFEHCARMYEAAVEEVTRYTAAQGGDSGGGGNGGRTIGVRVQSVW